MATVNRTVELTGRIARGYLLRAAGLAILLVARPQATVRSRAWLAAAPDDAAEFVRRLPGTRSVGADVTFQPGARSAWHSHPAGQRLVVTEGVGRTQQWGGPLQEIRAGDVVWCPPGVKHWHGAAPDSVMTHMALTGVRDEQAVTWMEHVSDEHYPGA